jgi:hypothetical protein
MNLETVWIGLTNKITSMKLLIHYLFIFGIITTCLVSFLKLIYLLIKPRFFENRKFNFITAAPSKRDLIIYNLVMVLATIDALYFLFGSK